MFKQVGNFIYRRLESKLNKKKIKNHLRRVHVVSEEELDRLCDRFYVSLISNVILTLAVTLFLCTLLFVKNKNDNGEVTLERDTYGGDETDMELETQIDGEAEVFDIQVLPLMYDEENINDAFEEGFEYLETVYLGDNETADMITHDLELPDYIDDFGLTVRWSSSDDEYVNSKGEIIEGVLETPVVINLTATLSYDDYQSERNFPVVIAGKEKSEAEEIIEDIKNYIQEIQLASADEEYITLPSEINGYEVSTKDGANIILVILIVGLVVCTLITVKGHSDLKSQEEKRDKKLLSVYPAFIDMLSLYMGAGFTVKAALTRISMVTKDKFLSDEISYTLNEIQSGIPETEGYYRLGTRLALPVYMKMMTLLSQNIKKGTRDILNMLENEEDSALQFKRELAKKKGEEAGTKLLFPMIIELGIVMIIIMLPALMSF